MRPVEVNSSGGDAEFAPEGLTVYLSNRCNLACGYCFAAAGGRGEDSSVVEEAAVLEAARLAAGHAAARGRPLRVVLHGGGEPTVHGELVQRLVEGTRRIANEAGAGWYGFLATNGVLSAQQARWLGGNLDLVGLSCDGPPEIQDRQRPLPSGAATSGAVERTARALVEAGARFSVRTTITPETLARQAEVVAYLHRSLGATHMRFEPVYGVRGTLAPQFRPEDAPAFVEHFLEAQREARARGCELQYMGVRLEERHGPHCDVLQDALHVLPDGTLTACFFQCEGAAPWLVGHWDGATWQLDYGRIAAHRRAVSQVSGRCRDCIAAFHCARECPERCSAIDDLAAHTPGFRCLVNRLLAERWILTAS